MRLTYRHHSSGDLISSTPCFSQSVTANQGLVQARKVLDVTSAVREPRELADPVHGPPPSGCRGHGCAWLLPVRWPMLGLRCLCLALELTARTGFHTGEPHTKLGIL